MVDRSGTLANPSSLPSTATAADRSKPPTTNYGILLLPSVGTLIAFFVVPLTIMFVYSFRKFDGPAQVGPVQYVLEN
jgi:ABC-type sugar transport system permease subunit